MEKFKSLVGIEAPVVTHDGGGELLISVLNGTVDLGIGEVQELSAQLEAKEVRIITTYTKQRLEQFPDVPTAQEQGIDLVVNKFRGIAGRSEEHTSELQSLMRISYAVFCLKKKQQC